MHVMLDSTQDPTQPHDRTPRDEGAPQRGAADDRERRRKVPRSQRDLVAASLLHCPPKRGPSGTT